MSNKKKILFLTGTRADFGKIKSLINAVELDQNFEPYVFVTGMHMLETYGYTLIEVQKSGFENIHTFENHTDESTMDLTLAKTIQGFSNHVKELNPDLIVVHGDRVEAMAGAIVGSLNNILVAHIEGGELSGTIDELIRHSVSKLSHIHFVANEEAKKRLIQMGELESSIKIIGSPDLDIMFSSTLPSIQEAKVYYEIEFSSYAIAMFHPVTTEVNQIKEQAEHFVDALIQSEKNYIVVFPNNDLGSKHILKAYEKLESNSKFRIFPSLRFEYFLTLLKQAEFIIGNSSAGIREAPCYGVPTINIGTRQSNRALHNHIINVDYEVNSILNAIQKKIGSFGTTDKKYGKGNSARLFLKSLKEDHFWKIAHQKQFKELD